MATREEQLAAEIAKRHYRVLASTEGRELLEHLKRRFYDGDLVAETDRETWMNLGAREVVRALLTGAEMLPKET